MDLDQRASTTMDPSASGGLLVNHVMSNDAKSRIFDDLISRFKRHSPPDITHVVSTRPVEGADVYHYHRPNLEKALLPRSILTVHHHLEDNDSWLEFAKFAPLYKQADTIVCLCAEQALWLTHRGYDQTTIIPHGVDEQFRCIEPASGRTKLRLGIASRRYARRVKGEALFGEIVKRLPTEDFAFTLIGAGRTAEAYLLQRLGFEVRVFEHLPYRLFPQFYSSINALLVLSHYEGGPACIPEGIASGTPIFSTRIGMSLDLIQAGENGEFLDRDPDADAAKLIRFAADEPYRLKLVEGARRLSSSAISWKDVSQRYVEIYRKVAVA